MVARGALAMAQKHGKGKKQRVRAGLLTKFVILALLAGLGWQLLQLKGQVEQAQVQRTSLEQQVNALQEENDALEADIAEGATQEKMEDLAREKLGVVSPNERVFYDVSN